MIREIPTESFIHRIQRKKDVIVSEKVLDDVSCVIETTIQIIDFCDCVFAVFKLFL